MTEMSAALCRVVNNSKSLLLDVDNNICEQFNSLINKHIAGKRINFSQKQSYTTRVYAAVVSFNTNGNLIRAIHKNITNKSPGILLYLKILWNSLPIYIVNYNKNKYINIFNFIVGIVAKKYLKYTADKKNNLKTRRALFQASGKYKKKIYPMDQMKIMD